MKFEKTIEKDGLPPVGSWCLIEQLSHKNDKNAWCPYKVVFYGFHKGCLSPMFLLYDLNIPKSDILSYHIIETSQRKTL